MKLRTQILLVLLLFALLPILVIVVTNLPRVLDLVGSLNRQVYLQDLRADFQDLDEHLASRREMLKLLAKLPEPGLMLGESSQQDPADIDLARAYYTEWINRILPDQLDIIQILFLGRDGQLRFWLEREREDQSWQPTLTPPTLPASSQVEKALSASRPEVLTSRVQLRPQAKEDDPRYFMNLHLVHPLGFVPEVGPTGAVMMAVDIGGMARRFSETYWAYDDGRYLEVSRQAETGRTAFDDFPGAAEQFSRRQQFLWTGGDGRQVIWVPLIQTAASGPLWVGRAVDATPLIDFRSQLIVRIAGIVLILMLLAWMAARWFAMRADRVGVELTEGISRLLAEDERVVFNWRWTNELKQLGEKLTRLAQKHVDNSRRVRNHTRELEASNRYKSQFLANVSHELRTPLNSIVLLSKMLAEKDSGLTEKQSQQARVIHQAGRDLQALIDDILDLSKIEAGRTALNLENIDLPAMLNELVALMQPQFDNKSLYLKVAMDPNAVLKINSDPDKVRQVLKNFLSNAVKFTDTGGVTLSLLAVDQADSSLPVCISVKDTGIGIAPDKQQLVFKAFKQVDGSTSRRYGGTGLGLSISQELASLLGGEIELISDVGQGADFRIRLPLVFDREKIREEQLGVDESAEDILLTEAHAQLQPEDATLSLVDRRALIIDSNVKNLLTLTTLLEQWGCQVTGAGDNEEVLEALGEEQFDLVLLDMMMPGSDGYATMKLIRQKYDCNSLPIIALTGAADHQQQESCLQGGANAYLVRPVDALVLKRELQELLP